MNTGDVVRCDGKDFTVLSQKEDRVFCLSEEGEISTKSVSSIEHIEPQKGLGNLSQKFGMTSLYCLFGRDGSFQP
uniref:Uncharacterized protein n=1 Tax=Marseillevirus sp. TaxID=2809551 RepID=A0AA96IYR4_9VIRU|nr:hypothetical protein MarFTMF_268 [Marseillevirus sp.]